MQVNVYRIVQECVNNIIRHSQATEATLVLKRNPGEIRLLVQDNGCGFVKAPAPTDGVLRDGRGGFGLIGIAERVRMLHGNYEIDSDHGTTIRIEIPGGEKGSGGEWGTREWGRAE